MRVVIDTNVFVSLPFIRRQRLIIVAAVMIETTAYGVSRHKH